MPENNQVVIKTYGEDAIQISGKLSNGINYELKHVNNDPDNIYRLYLENDSCSLEITPSKGLSVRNFTYEGINFFWEPPMNILPDPVNIDVEDSMIINGIEVKGTRWLEYFACHIEMLGLDNWGMNKETNSKIFGLHGNVSLIPANEVVVSGSKESVTVSGKLYIYDPNKIFPVSNGDKPYFIVEKNIELFLNKPALMIRDVVKNIGDKPRFPDWGYHVQLRPEKGSRYFIPSKEVRKRGGGDPEVNYEYWHEASEEPVRVERGYIHKKLLYKEYAFPGGGDGTETLLVYSNGTGIKCTIPPAPYTLSWFSCGGKNGSEFIIPGENGLPGKRLLEKNWDGVGPEFGASALDGDGDTDPDVEQEILHPGESKELKIYLELLNNEKVSSLLSEIVEYMQD